MSDALRHAEKSPLHGDACAWLVKTIIRATARTTIDKGAPTFITSPFKNLTYPDQKSFFLLLAYS